MNVIILPKKTGKSIKDEWGSWKNKDVYTEFKILKKNNKIYRIIWIGQNQSFDPEFYTDYSVNNKNEHTITYSCQDPAIEHVMITFIKPTQRADSTNYDLQLYLKYQGLEVKFDLTQVNSFTR